MDVQHPAGNLQGTDKDSLPSTLIEWPRTKRVAGFGCEKGGEAERALANYLVHRSASSRTSTVVAITGLGRTS